MFEGLQRGYRTGTKGYKAQIHGKGFRLRQPHGSGQSVQVTDNGKQLWVIRPAHREEDEEERAPAIDELLDEAL